MNMGLLVQDVMYGVKVHEFLEKIDLFYAELTNEEWSIVKIAAEIKGCPSFRHLSHDVDRKVAFRIIIRELNFRFLSNFQEQLFPIAIVLLILLDQIRLLESRTLKQCVNVVASESMRWIMIGHELGYLDNSELQVMYKKDLGVTYNHWIADIKSAEEMIARGSFKADDSMVTDRRSFR